MKDQAPDCSLEADKLCEVCSHIVRSTKYKGWHDAKEKSEETWPHHKNMDALRMAASNGCHLCTLLEVQTLGYPLENLTFCLKWKRKGHRRLKQHILECGLLNDAGLVEQNGLEKLGIGEHREEGDGGLHFTNSTASASTLDLAQQWLQSCRDTHTDCAVQNMSSTETGPRRLLVLSRSGNASPMVRLEECADRAERRDYLALSYCWGPAVTVKLLQENYQTFLENIPFEILPKTLRDAVDITLRLGLEALWVDALCIIQDDGKDWEIEAQKMGSVYRNSVCTISAWDGDHSDSGCYARSNPLMFIPCRIKLASGDVILRAPRIGDRIDETTPGHWSCLAALGTRGWGVQEQALPARTLYFSDMGIWWECFAQSQFEFQHLVSEESWETRWAYSLKREVYAALQRITFEKENGISSSSWLELWHSLIYKYTRCDLTFDTDRWPAISGLAGIFRSKTGANLTHGMWEEQIIRDLCWKLNYSWDYISDKRNDCWTTGSAARSNSAPSWSWLSNTGPIWWLDGEDLRPLATTVASDIRGSGEEDKVDEPKDYLRIKAPMLQFSARSPPVAANPYLIGNAAGLLDHLQIGHWEPDGDDIPKSQSLWAMFCLIGVPTRWGAGNTVQGLVIASDEHGRWRRTGFFALSVFLSDVTIEDLVEQKVVDLY